MYKMEILFGLQKIQIFFGVLDISDIFFDNQLMLGPSLRMKIK